MAIQRTRDDERAAFNLGMSDAPAKVAQRQAPPPRQPAPRLATPPQAAQPGRESGGNDPYNTSGSFDRSRNWARVGKR